MRMESFDMRRDLAEEAQRAASIEKLAAQCQTAGAAFAQHSVPPAQRRSALTGLTVALPVALSLWTVIVMLLWLLLR